MVDTMMEDIELDGLPGPTARHTVISTSLAAGLARVPITNGHKKQNTVYSNHPT